MKNRDHLNILFQKYLNQRCSPDEMKQLLDYFGASQSDEGLLKKLVGEALNEQDTMAVDMETSKRLDTCLENIKANRIMPGKLRKIILTSIYRRWVVAATLFIAVCTVFFFTQKLNTAKQIVHKPGTEKAKLTLADGTVIDLEQAVNGKLVNKDGIAVTKTADGKLVYDAKNTTQVNGVVSYNTLVTPRGGQYKVILPDGSEIWLNAASSLRFPTQFAGKERRVELSGEGYFEIKKNEKQPFIVVSGRQEVTVLGTHFNINAYQENQVFKTTLLEGAVKISTAKNSFLLAPGQAASLDKSSNGISIAKNVNVEDVIAWKEGYFMFNNEPLEDVMHRVGNWYNVEVEFASISLKSEKVYGDISRSENLAQVLNMLEKTGVATFDVNTRTIIVKTKK